MSHRMNDTKTYIRESHTSNVLSKCHVFSSLRIIFTCSTKASCDNFDSFDMEHVCHFPCSFCDVSFDSMCQSIHTCWCCKTIWHTAHHIRVNDSYYWNIFRVYTNKFTLFFIIFDNVVDCYLCCCSCCCRYGNDRYSWFCCRSYSL